MGTGCKCYAKRVASKSIPFVGHCNQTPCCNTAFVCAKPHAFLGNWLSIVFVLLVSNTVLLWATGGLWLIWLTFWITVNSCNLTISSKYLFALIIQSLRSKNYWNSTSVLVKKSTLGIYRRWKIKALRQPGHSSEAVAVLMRHAIQQDFSSIRVCGLV